MPKNPIELPPRALGLSGQSVTSYMVCAEAERDGTGTCDVRGSWMKWNIRVIFQNPPCREIQEVRLWSIIEGLGNLWD